MSGHQSRWLSHGISGMNGNSVSASWTLLAGGVTRSPTSPLPPKTVHVNTLTTRSTSDHTRQTSWIINLPRTLIQQQSLGQFPQSSRSANENAAGPRANPHPKLLDRTRGRVMSLTVIRGAAGDLKSQQHTHTQPVVHV